MTIPGGIAFDCALLVIGALFAFKADAIFRDWVHFRAVGRIVRRTLYSVIVTRMLGAMWLVLGSIFLVSMLRQ